MMTMLLPIDEIAEIFHDVTPIPQDDDGPADPVCTIEYPTAFRIAHEYMRACFKCGEKSERSLKLSATCLKLNPANYTVWHYRRACMDALGYFDSLSVAKTRIQQDLGLASQLGGNNPKNYQVWYHRRALLEAFHTLVTKPDSSSVTATESLEAEFLEAELDYLANVLDHDSKNYHAWSHRQWLIRTINSQKVWDQDVEYTAMLIQKDPRNNSAWNERWFAVHKCLKQPPLSLDKCRAEADYAIFQGAILDPYNESPFRYLIGLLQEQQQQPQSDTTSTNIITPKMLAAEFYTKVQSLEKVLVDANRDPEACTNWTSARIDLLESMGDAASLTQAITLAQGLSNQYDTIRQKYWEFRRRQLQQQLTTSS